MKNISDETSIPRQLFSFVDFKKLAPRDKQDEFLNGFVIDREVKRREVKLRDALRSDMQFKVKEGAPGGGCTRFYGFKLLNQHSVASIIPYKYICTLSWRYAKYQSSSLLAHIAARPSFAFTISKALITRRAGSPKVRSLVKTKQSLPAALVMPFTADSEELDLRIKQRTKGDNRYLDGKTFASNFHQMQIWDYSNMITRLSIDCLRRLLIYRGNIKIEKMSTAGELACSYACMLLHDDGIPITADKIAALVKAANVQVEAYWPGLFAKLVEKRNIEDLIMNVGSGGGGGAPVAVAASGGGGAPAAVAAPAAEEKKEEPKEESDEDMGFKITQGTPKSKLSANASAGLVGLWGPAGIRIPVLFLEIFFCFSSTKMSTASELACTYACMLLHDEGIPVTAEKIAAVVKAANVQVEAYWPGLFAKFVQKRNIEDMIMNGSSGGGGAPVSVTASAGGDAIFAVAAPVAEEKKEELKEESDMTKIFSICFHKLGTPIPSNDARATAVCHN
ncbi:hypothetical protein IFM89_027850 [Coptis chinensis]|uniref:60S acidic ribosomal protein P1 n=1 Tax=Coptis chinensis TaxID=261450 RepID=A0A835LMX4_9MAGN|nr:hypothetical protein IFM89_027850 [Coptis chinensis]